MVYFSWTGCFVGGNGGGLWATKDWTVGTADPIFGGGSFGSHNVNSWVAGAQIGCDYQIGGFVIGAQGDWDWTNGTGTSNDALNGAGFTDQSNIKGLGSATVRVGYAFDRFLGYVRGGAAWERDNYAILFAGTTVATASETRSGWTVGVGGEYAFANWISAFLEYDYYDFGTKNNRLVTGGGVLFDSVDIRERKSVVKAGLNLRWGPGAVTARY
jgi:outer membrane immunogenic protein